MYFVEFDDADYRRLLGFRNGIRRFLRWSEEQAVAVGLTPSQHQLLLAIRGHDGDASPTVGDIADHLLLKHHSCGELINRAENAGLVERRPDADDHRVVRIVLSDRATSVLESLSSQHLAELRRLEPSLRPIWADL